MKTISLSQGKIAVVDDIDYERVSQWKWSYFKAKDGGERAVRHSEGTSIYLHRFIMEAKRFEEIDHKDRNGLNNQRSNLRVASRSQNAANRGVQVNSRSGFKGVTYDNRPKRIRRWMAYAKKNNKRVHIGYYLTAQEAAIAYNRTALELHGEFAVLNVVDGFALS